MSGRATVCLGGDLLPHPSLPHRPAAAVAAHAAAHAHPCCRARWVRWLAAKWRSIVLVVAYVAFVLWLVLVLVLVLVLLLAFALVL